MNMSLNVDNDVFGAYIFWSAMLVVKMLLMAPLTGMQRFKKKVLKYPISGHCVTI
jgi:glutathione S-transferase